MFLGMANEDGGVLFPPVVVVLYMAFATLIRHIVTLIGTVTTNASVFNSTLRLIITILLVALNLVVIIGSFGDCIGDGGNDRLTRGRRDRGTGSIRTWDLVLCSMVGEHFSMSRVIQNKTLFSFNFGQTGTRYSV